MERIKKYLNKKGVNYECKNFQTNDVDGAKETLFINIEELGVQKNRTLILNYLERNTVWRYAGNYEYFQVMSIRF